MDKLFTEYSAHYFFSAWLQADAALISIVAIFIIFKLQSLNSKIDSIKTIISITGKLTILEFVGFEEGELTERTDIIKRKMEAYNTRSIGKMLGDWHNSEIKLKNLKSKMKLPIQIAAIALITSGCCLFISSYIHSLGYLVEFIITFLILIFHLFMVVLNTSFVISSIKN